MLIKILYDFLVEKLPRNLISHLQVFYDVKIFLLTLNLKKINNNQIFHMLINNSA